MQDLKKNPIIERLTARKIVWLDGSREYHINTIPPVKEQDWDVKVRQAAIARRFK